MKIDIELERVEKYLKDVEAIRDMIKEAARNTQTILDVCSAMGIDRVGIGARNDNLKDSKGYPFGYGGSIFVDGRSEGWPVAWAVAEKAGFSRGCGNTGQHGVRGNFLDGVYVCKNGAWRKE